MAIYEVGFYSALVRMKLVSTGIWLTPPTGFLFRAQPSLLIAESSSHIMDEIFNSQDEEARCRLLKIMQEFLVAEAEKYATLQKEKSRQPVPYAIRPTHRDLVVLRTQIAESTLNMEELVGNTDQFADSGCVERLLSVHGVFIPRSRVSSAVVQRYLHFILKAALSTNSQMQAAAVDILSFTIKQGLAHPLQVRSCDCCRSLLTTAQCFPVVVALETSANPSFSTRASGLHLILHSKHTSLLNSRYVHSARASFVYQKATVSGTVRGQCSSQCLGYVYLTVFRLQATAGAHRIAPPLVLFGSRETPHPPGIPQSDGQSI